MLQNESKSAKTVAQNDLLRSNLRRRNPCPCVRQQDEPNPDFHVKLLAGRPRDRNLAFCISDVSTELEFHLVGNEGHSTLDVELAERLKVKQLPQSTIRVQSHPLFEIFEPSDPPIDFLKVDVEGSEGCLL
jgi:hypothetical protein